METSQKQQQLQQQAQAVSNKYLEENNKTCL
jgi:hypothetical protein